MKRNKAAFFILLFSCGLGFSQDPSVQAWQWLQDLGDDNPEKRETATFKLIEHFKTAELPVRQFQKETTDPEVKGRLNEILREGPKDPRVRALEASLSSRARDLLPRIAFQMYANDEPSLSAIVEQTAYNIPLRDKSLNYAYAQDTKVLRKALLERLFLNPNLWSITKNRYTQNLFFESILRTAENEEMEKEKMISILRPFLNDPVKMDFRGGALKELLKIQDPNQTIQDAQKILDGNDSSDSYHLSVAIWALTELRSKEQSGLIRSLINNPITAGYVLNYCQRYFITVFPDTEEAAQAAVDMIELSMGSWNVKEGLEYLAQSPFVSKHRKVIERIANDRTFEDSLRSRARDILNDLDAKK